MTLSVSSALLLITLSYISVINGRSEEVEVILLPSTSWSIHQDEIPLAFTAFGHSIELKLKKNRKLVSPSFQVWKHDERKTTKIPQLSEPLSCHYIHQDGTITAAVSLCEEGIFNGLVLLDNETLEITPLKETKSIDFLNSSLFPSLDDSKAPHFVKRSYLSSSLVSNDISEKDDRSDEYINFTKKLPVTDEDASFSSRSQRGQFTSELTIELAVFFDEAAYNLFSPFFDQNERKIRDMLLAYVNGIQALFHHRSLGTRIDVSLVRVEIMKKQPFDLPHYNGERERLLDSFCRYAKDENPTGDDDPDHWDIGLYVSGLDFYAFENGKKNGVTMGLAPVNGVCYDDYACVIAELGVTNRFGKPYPSAGFTSVYIAAHEIGHNLGMRHDSSDNSCPKDGFIMSPSRGTQGETIWSPCSRSIALKLRETKPCLSDKKAESSSGFQHSHPSLDHAARYRGLPGREWTSKKQCELLLRDKDATYVTLANACQSLQCTSPHRSGYYYAGPALEGTVCAQGKECRGGECLPTIPTENHYKPGKPGSSNTGWSKWKEEPCSSGCIVNSKGARVRRRTCRESSTIRRAASFGCGSPGGFAYDVVLCKDEKMCKKRILVTDFASTRCIKYSEYLTEIDGEGGGLQAGHETARPWMACAIFCRRNDIASYYTPRIELNDLGLDPYFPDGTWCHRDDDQDYFCLRHHCLPKNFTFASKDSLSSLSPASSSGSAIASRYIVNENSILGPRNASPNNYNIPKQLMKYLSSDIEGLPISKTPPISRPDVPHDNQDHDAWIDTDYLELPENLGDPLININNEDLPLSRRQEFDRLG